MGERPNKRIEDHLGKIADEVGELASAYGIANGEEIRSERERTLDALRRQSFMGSDS